MGGNPPVDIKDVTSVCAHCSLEAISSTGGKPSCPGRRERADPQVHIE